MARARARDNASCLSFISFNLYIINMKNAREAAYIALLESYQGKAFVHENLSNFLPDNPKDLTLAREIAYGTIRMSLALDYLAAQLAGRKLKVKPKERLLIQMAIYQYFYMDKVPVYAIVDETIKIARKYCHSTFVSFLNAILRKLSTVSFKLPDDISIKYSYPTYFVGLLVRHYGKENAEHILDVGNKPSQTMVRIRKNSTDDFELICEKPFPVGRIKDSSKIAVISKSENFYIQNATQATLIGSLCESLDNSPQAVLDVCASPGGKAIAVQDYFPEALIHVNDLSQEKLERLEENCKKYHLNFKMSCSPGELLKLPNKFDVVILDVPCSNSGVLNKRPEARWRLSKENIQSLNQMQLKLLENAKQLVSESGQIWYMTCSILPEENEKLITRACKDYGLALGGFQKTILPNEEGWDGGFACNLVF